MTFKKAKTLIRQALRSATDEQLATLLIDARAGKVPYSDSCRCFVAHLGMRIFLRTFRSRILMEHPWSSAYNQLCAWRCCGEDFNARDATRQRILVPMVLAEISRRTRDQSFPLATVPGVRVISSRGIEGR